MVNEDRVNLLLVDDRPENLLALEAIIERDDYHLIKASSGEEALVQLMKVDFATILLDVQMPGMDGYATAKIIKARERTKHIPILFITANNMDAEHIFRGYSLGAVDYILKPFDPFILKAKVESFVDLYRMNLRLIQHAEELADKTLQLERANHELTELSNELRASEALTNVISETSLDSMIVVDELGTILKVNPAVTSMFQYEADELLGLPIRTLFSSPLSQSFIAGIMDRTALHEQAHRYEVTASRKDGTEFFAEIQAGRRYVRNKSIAAIMIHDTTSKKEAEALITHMAYHDGLTKLPNRRFYNNQLNACIAEAKQNGQMFAMLYLDMDRFKYINDSLGHIVGDQLLQLIGERLTDSVRKGDFVARIGGDEFNIILPNTNRERAIELAEDILGRFRVPFHIDQYELFVTTSIGMSIFPYDGEDSQFLMKNADAALYRAKEQGKNKLKIFHSGMNLHSYRAFVLQNDLYKAVERQELTLHYQPRIDLTTGRIDSAEALLRWEHPNWGLVMPGEFIPLAEESGLIVEIGMWVLEAALQQIRAWEAAGLAPIRAAVNFSAQQFLQKELVERIDAAIAAAGVDPSRLEIEITETMLMNNEEAVTNTLAQLRKRSITISIDDFGVGYSSLNYLRRYPLDTLKIDRSFVRDISPKSPESIALISSIIKLARSLNMEVIVEGVETEMQLEALRQEQCTIIQGYLFCPPVPPDEFEVFLLQNHSDKTAAESEALPDLRLPVAAPLPVPSSVTYDTNQAILQAAVLRTREQYAISARETEVFELIIEGLTNKEISDRLFISEHTVKNHITHIFQKMNVSDRMQAMSHIYQACMEESFRVQAQA
jgi:diguanylate cyclase (GGDEF)-like protein/PAS domain S-box-containing protein